MQYRYAAIESCEDDSQHARAISMIMIGAMFSAILGPELIRSSQISFFFYYQFTWSYVIVALLHVIAAFLLLKLAPITYDEQNENEDDKVKIESKVHTRPIFWMSVITAITAYFVMSFIMLTPLSMKEHGFDIESTKMVIQGHILAMYAPSFFSAKL